MRIFLFFLLICLLPTGAFAQEDDISSQKYFPEGMCWKEVLAEPGMPMDTTFAKVYEIGSDTISNNVKYHKVLRNGEYSGKLVREQDNKVWVKLDDFPEEIKLYDFNWDSADTIRTEYVDVWDEEKTLRTYEMYVGDIHTTRFDDRLWQYHKDFDGVIIRGIGRVSELIRDGCLLGCIVDNPVIPGLIYYKVLWLKRDGKIVFSSNLPMEWIEFIPESTKAIPFLQEGKTWRLLYTNYFYKDKYYHPSHENWFYIKNKEIVGGHEYFLIREEIMTFDSNTHGWERASSNSSNVHDGEDDCFYLHLREENGRVFVLKDDYISFCISKYGANPDISSMQVDGEDDVLLYDFNLIAGDKYPFPGHVTVQEIGEMSYNGTTYPYQLLSNNLLIVEGVGCVNSFGGLVEYQSKPVVSDYYGVYATYLNWVVVEDNQEEIFQYVNAMSDEQWLDVSEAYTIKHPKDGFIHDIQGRPLPQKPVKGIYIQNGEKRMVK